MCECRWQMVRNYPVGKGRTYTGDLLVEECPYHRWYGELSAADARLVSAMERAGVPAELRPVLLEQRRTRS